MGVGEGVSFAWSLPGVFLLEIAPAPGQPDPHAAPHLIALFPAV